MPDEKKTDGLTAKQRRFVAEYLVDQCAAAAYRRAGYRATGNSAETSATRLLRNVQVRAAIEAQRTKTAAKLQIDAERVMLEAWAILTADPRELIGYHVGCCRYCWGAGHRYQRTVAERERDLSAHVATRASGANDARPARRARFDELGGVGFKATREPHPDCPECFGEGVGRTVLADTRRISPAAAALYAGVKQTREGIEVKMHSKLDAAEKLSRHLGLYDRVKVNSDFAEALRALAPASLSERGRAVLAGAASGDIPVSQASQLIASLAALAQIVKTDELAARIAAVEAQRGNP